MRGYPLIFRTTHLVQAAKYRALIRVDGRLLMTEEFGEWTCSGVEPGALVECGSGPTVAYEVFRASLRGVFDDLAEESESLDEFRSSVEAFFRTDETEAGLWQKALEELRTVKDPLDPEFKSMARLAPRDSTIVVTEVAQEPKSPTTEDPEAKLVSRSASKSVGGLGDHLDLQADAIALAKLPKAA